MGGFTNLIYFKEYLSEESTNRIKKAIESCGEFELEEDLDYDIRIEHDGENYPFRIYYSKDQGDFDPESISEFLKKIGYVPKCYIGFMAWTNVKFGQKFIAELMLRILEIEDGLVDLSAAIDPNLTGNKDKIKEFVSKIDGEIIELEYVTERERIWFTHLADKEFLRNWVRHKKFYIPK